MLGHNNMFTDLDMEDLTSLHHYGMPRRSGRYPWGSGEDPYQHGSRDFISRVEEIRKKNPGISKTEIAKAMGMKTPEFRTKYNIANTQRRLYENDTIRTLHDKYGLTPTEIGKKLGLNESSVRSKLKSSVSKNLVKNNATAEFLKSKIDEHGFVDVGPEAGRELGISNSRMASALKIIQAEGYNVYGGRVPYVTNPNSTQRLAIQVACGPKATYLDVFGKNGAARSGKVESLMEYQSTDGGMTYGKSVYPASIDRKRVYVRYAEDGGLDRDGTIELREGVKDISLGNSRYAQVRIAVDDKYYMKGMALYSKDIPNGYDVVYNVNKKRGTPDEDVFKELKKDNKSNPFGVLLKLGGQSYYEDPNGTHINEKTGKRESLRVINKIKEEGDWVDYNRETPAQFLSKQNISLAKLLLDTSLDERKAYYNEIKSIQNPTLKKYLLNDFAEACDKASWQLKAAALPRQAYQVILPVPNLKDDEIYAPQFKDGEKLALVRFPHGGTFEIPILRNNTKSPDGIKTLGNATDAVGINKKNADRLSGADFDGDTALVIPTGKNKLTNIVSTKMPELLIDYDPKDVYGTTKRDTGKKDKDGKPIYEYLNKDGHVIKVMDEKYKQKQMGIVSNLITDMSIKGATPEEIALADRHSMTVIDAVKHHLDYQTSAKENQISYLQKKWQTHVDLDGKVKNGGASTLISRAKNEYDVTQRQGNAKVNKIDPKTGKLIIPDLPEGALYYTESSRARYIDENGKPQVKTQASKQMLEVQDAMKLSSGTAMENEYAAYANNMKMLANESRKEALSVPRLKMSKAAKETYSEEVKTLNEKLNLALTNTPRERRAQNIASGEIKALLADNPSLKYDKDKLKKRRQQALEDARLSVSASSKDKKISFTKREWEAIMAGAISDTAFQTMMKKADKKALLELALPKKEQKISDATVSRIKAYAARGYTQVQIAEFLGISPTTVRNKLKG